VCTSAAGSSLEFCRLILVLWQVPVGRSLQLTAMILRVVCCEPGVIYLSCWMMAWGCTLTRHGRYPKGLFCWFYGLVRDLVDSLCRSVFFPHLVALVPWKSFWWKEGILAVRSVFDHAFPRCFDVLKSYQRRRLRVVLVVVVVWPSVIDPHGLFATRNGLFLRFRNRRPRFFVWQCIFLAMQPLACAIGLLFDADCIDRLCLLFGNPGKLPYCRSVSLTETKLLQWIVWLVHGLGGECHEGPLHSDWCIFLLLR